jgi:lipoprotein NlpI
MGQVDAALRDYEQALSLDPKLAYVYNDRSVIWMDRGDHARAMMDIDHALRLDPRYSNAHMNRGSALLGQGKKIEAMAEFDRAVRRQLDLAADDN